MDVVEEFSPEVRAQLLPAEIAAGGEAAEPGLFEASLSPDQKMVFESLRVDEATFVDSVFGAVALPQPRVLAVLLELEMSGLIRQLPGKNFIRKL